MSTVQLHERNARRRDKHVRRVVVVVLGRGVEGSGDGVSIFLCVYCPFHQKKIEFIRNMSSSSSIIYQQYVAVTHKKT